ncbi:MAG: hypothetical protein KatS3mg118_3019 [Paracoccaceae bacterium]|nr:MAG: hypothetical protein KatS3mg118_3019 [Paracoccaceae bacterium]
MSRSFRNNRIRAQFHIATPMFLGGANHETARIRGSAVKGALAFWWRAFHFAHHVQEPGRNVNDALTTLRDREKRLFGSSDGGQGRFLLRVRHGEMKQHPSGEVLKNGSSDLGTGARYLGYGLMGAFGKDAGRLQRSCLVEGQNFTVELLFRPGSTDDDRREMRVALKLLGLLGGLGSRVRRGWGSVALIRSWRGPARTWQAPGSGAKTTSRRSCRPCSANHPCREPVGRQLAADGLRPGKRGVGVGRTFEQQSRHAGQARPRDAQLSRHGARCGNKGRRPANSETVPGGP